MKGCVIFMVPVAGLTGLFQAPLRRNDKSSIYMVADNDSRSLFIFVMLPGSYQDAYEVASLVWYQNIFIVPVSLDGNYLSDVTRLVTDLSKIKQTVKIIHPVKTPYRVNTLIENSFVRSSEGHSNYIYTNGFISFNWGLTDNLYINDRYFDIYIKFNNRTVLLCPFEVNRTRILDMLKQNYVDYVYIPFSSAQFGNDSFLTVIDDEDFANYKNKLVACGFANPTEAAVAYQNYPYSFPCTIRWVFLRSEITVTEETELVVVGNREWNSRLYTGMPFPLENDTFVTV